MKALRILIGIGILATGIALAALIWVTRPRATIKSEEAPLPVVEYQVATFGDLEVEVPSQGMVEPARRITLSAEVGGRVVSVSNRFDTGGTFAGGEEILRIEDSDYLAALARAESSLADARLALQSEIARSEQALRDWKKLGSDEIPSDLALRKPQLASAEAAVKAAEAEMKRARRDLDRTRIVAPFPATIESIQTELGSVVAPGAPLAGIFQTAPFEIRLPVSLDESRFLRSTPEGKPAGTVLLEATAGDRTLRWNGKIVRTEGSIERSSRSLHVVAQLEEGETAASPLLRLQPGLFVQATISGRTLSKVARIPFPAFLDLDHVVVIDPDDRLRFREVNIVRRETDAVIVSGGLKGGDRICVTELSDMIEGMQVNPVLQNDPVLTDTADDVPEPVKP